MASFIESFLGGTAVYGDAAIVLAPRNGHAER